MTKTHTYQITVQPWTSRLVSVGFSKATYTNSGRQKWQQLSRRDVAYQGVREEVLYVLELLEEHLESCRMSMRVADSEPDATTE